MNDHCEREARALFEALWPDTYARALEFAAECSAERTALREMEAIDLLVRTPG